MNNPMRKILRDQLVYNQKELKDPDLPSGHFKYECTLTDPNTGRTVDKWERIDVKTRIAEILKEGRLIVEREAREAKLAQKTVSRSERFFQFKKSGTH